MLTDCQTLLVEGRKGRLHLLLARPLANGIRWLAWLEDGYLRPRGCTDPYLSQCISLPQSKLPPLPYLVAMKIEEGQHHFSSCAGAPQIIRPLTDTLRSPQPDLLVDQELCAHNNQNSLAEVEARACNLNTPPLHSRLRHFALVRNASLGGQAFLPTRPNRNPPFGSLLCDTTTPQRLLTTVDGPSGLHSPAAVPHTSRTGGYPKRFYQNTHTHTHIYIYIYIYTYILTHVYTNIQIHTYKYRHSMIVENRSLSQHRED